jgi:hypothetical protein
MTEEKNATVAIAIDEIQTVDESDPEISQVPAYETEGRPFLPPTDRGRGAFMFMLSAFMVEAIMWGIYAFLTFFLNTLVDKRNQDFHLPLAYSSLTTANNQIFKGVNTFQSSELWQ